MAQSAWGTKKATKKAAKTVNKEQLKATNPDEVLDWEVSNVESGLKALGFEYSKVVFLNFFAFNVSRFWGILYRDF